MKVKVLLLVCILLASVVVFQAGLLKTEEVTAVTAESYNFYTHGIEDSGVVVRVYFRVLVQYSDWHYEWHYYGVDPAEEPPHVHQEATVYEHPYVQFPTDFNELPTDGEYEQHIYGLGFEAGLYKEGIKTGP